MADELKSSLTAAKLKAFCILNDLPTSGKKSDLIARLLDAGLSNEELGIESEVIETAEIAEEPAVAVLSLEDEDTITPEVEPVVERTVQTEEPKPPADDEVMEAEILDAEVISLDEEVKSTPKTEPVNSIKSEEGFATLLDMIKQPKFAAIALVLMILGAGTWYYFNNKLEPFTADTLRYGDSMTYTISDGDFMASEGFLDLVLDQIETDDDICKLRLLFGGTGTAEITNGDSDELTSQASLARLGAVSAKGGQGMDWLAVESSSKYDLDTLTIQRHVRSLIPGSTDKCSSTFASASGTAELTSLRHTELRDRATLATSVDWELNLDDAYRGNLMTFGVGGLLGELEEISPGFSMILQPVELRDLLSNDYIDEGSTGSRQGWDWRVLGTEKLGSTEMWKIIATNSDVESLCLGSATMTLLVEEGNPWATKQDVNVVISGSDSSRTGCSFTTELLGDYVLPDGELTMSHTFQKSKLNRGSKNLEYGLSYDGMPQANELSPDEDDLSNWGVDGKHLPDNSQLRSHTVEDAVQCFDHFQSVSPAAYNALDDSGYVWRAIDTKHTDKTEWNISWIASDNTAGWVNFNITGSPSAENCQFEQYGSYDESISYNREFIPAVLNISEIETKLMDETRFPQLTSADGLFQADSYHSETRVGYLVVVPGSGVNSILSNIGDATKGATTIDMSRDWSDNGWNKQFNLVVDATDGRVIGWNYVMNT